mgnify:CR=1 FL=1
MKKIYIYLLFVVIGILPIYSQTTLTQANEAYGQEDYITAIELYEQTLREQGVSSDLYYNLGNAYYKHNEFAKAILNYERALLLNPGNEDARFNLEMANTHIVDKIDPVGKFFLSVWIDSLRNFLSSNTWAVIGIVSFLLFIGGLYLYLFSKSVAANTMASLRAFNLLFNPHANQLARTAIKKSIIPPKKPNFFALTDLENRPLYFT